jgi:hypothetical protein
MSARLKLTSAAAILAVAITAAVVATRGDASRDGAAFSNHGMATVAVPNLSSRWVRITEARLLARRNGRALYRLTRANGVPCFGVGPADDVGHITAADCPRGGFPTSGSPMLDFSIYEGTRHDAREFSLYRAEGFAADGVAAVEFFRPDGTVVLRVPVKDNVYESSAVPKGPIAGAYAVDKDGKRLARSP